MSLYCTLPRGGGSYYHSSVHSGSSFPSSSSSSSSSSPSSSSSSTSTITSDNNSILTQGETIGNNNYHHRHSVNARYQHQSIKTMFNNPYNNSQQATFNENSNSTNLLAHSLINQQQQQQILSKYQQDYQDYQQFQQQQNVLPTIDSSNGKNFSPASSVLPSPQGNQFNGIFNSLTNSVNMCNNNIDNNGSIATTNNMNNYNQQTSKHQSLQLTLPRPEPQRIYYGLDSFDDLKAIRRNSITSLFEQDPSTPNFYGDEDSAYDSTSNESLRLTAKELTKRSNSKKYFTLPTKLGRRLRKASLPEFNHGANSLTPSPVSSDCSPSPKLIFNGPTFPPSNSKSSSSASSSISSSSSVSPPSTSSSSLSSSNVSNVSVSSAPSTSLATEMSAPHNHHVESCAYNNQLINKTTSNGPDNSASPGANENVTCHCCYLLGCHSNQSPSIYNTAHYQNNQQYQQQQQQQQPQQHGRVNSGVVNTGTSANNIVSSTGQQSTLETLWEEPSSGHESVRLTEEAIYAAMRELNISLPSKDAVTGQSVGNRNGNSSSWLRANFLKAFRRSSSSSSSKNRSSKLISSNPSSASSNNNASLSYPEREQPVTKTSTTIRPVSLSGPIGHTGATTMTLNQPCQPYPDVNGGDTISATSGSEISSSKRIISSGPSSASSLSSLPLSCSSVPPTPPLTPLPPYHSQQQQQLQPPPPELHINQNYHHHNQNQHNQNEAQQHEQYLSHTLYASEEDVIKELNRQLAEKDQLLQEVCMESINHLNTIESLKELVAQLKDEIVSLKKQNDQLNHGIQYSLNMDKVKPVNQVNNRNCA